MPADVIFRHPSGGELHQGDRYDAESAAVESPLRYRMLVLAAYETPKFAVPAALDTVRIPLDDTFDLSARHMEEIRAAASTIARTAARRIATGRKVLVTCNEGRNRSGLVSGLTLRALGFPGEDAVRLVKERRKAERGPALSNYLFADIVRLGLADERAQNPYREAGALPPLMPIVPPNGGMPVLEMQRWWGMPRPVVTPRFAFPPRAFPAVPVAPKRGGAW